MQWVLPLISILLLNHQKHFSRIVWGLPIYLIFQVDLLALLLRSGSVPSTLCPYPHWTLLRCWDAISSQMENCWWDFSFFISIHIWIIFGNNQTTTMKTWALLFPWWAIQFNSLGCIKHLVNNQKGKIFEPPKYPQTFPLPIGFNCKLTSCYQISGNQTFLSSICKTSVFLKMKHTKLYWITDKNLKTNTTVQ